LKSRALRLAFHEALSKWQYLVGSNEALYELGIGVWRKIVPSLPVRKHLLVCDDNPDSPLSLPYQSRVLVTTVDDAKLDHFEAVSREAEALANAPDVENVFAAMTKGGDRYHFRLPLNPRDVTDPRNAVFVKFALQPRILGLVRKHFRMPFRLNEVTVLLDRPTSGPAVESQLWHRDPDDWITVSVFVYLSSVGTDTAPFCYIPLDQSRKLYGKVGKFRQFPTWHLISDATMEALVPRKQWVEVIGQRGTVTFIDSASCYHRGKQAVSAGRLSMHLIFTSPLSRMELKEDWDHLLPRESERKYASESPLYQVASSAPLRGGSERSGSPE
jgi:hypothetical protein